LGLGNIISSVHFPRVIPGGENVVLVLGVNTASADELEEIPYNTRGVAASIIAHRPYRTLDELDVASGIGKRRIEQLRAYLTVK
jgi:DNA uptake protein ComE-like DNA-binding protein